MIFIDGKNRIGLFQEIGSSFLVGIIITLKLRCQNIDLTDTDGT